MQIEYIATKSKRTVADAIGKQLVANGIARAVYDTRQLKVETVSQQNGKPKRQYRRRDMRAAG